MSNQNTAELIGIKNQIHSIEAEMEELMNDFIRKSKIDYNRTDDYAERGFTLTIEFDRFNIEGFKNKDKMEKLYNYFVGLKKKQRACEEEYNSENFVTKQLKEDMRDAN